VDFVVVGLGLGALGILLGVTLLGWVAGRWERDGRVAAPDEAAYYLAVAVNRQGAGQALVFAGGAILLATIGALAGSLDDQTGAFLVATTATVALLSLLIWAWLHRVRIPAPFRHRRPAPTSYAGEAPRPALAPEARRPARGQAAALATAMADDVPLTSHENTEAAQSAPTALSSADQDTQILDPANPDLLAEGRGPLPEPDGLDSAVVGSHVEMNPAAPPLRHAPEEDDGPRGERAGVGNGAPSPKRVDEDAP
jgi:hypothetical protein